jgi:hypothetical protein
MLADDAQQPRHCHEPDVQEQLVKSWLPHWHRQPWALAPHGSPQRASWAAGHLPQLCVEVAQAHLPELHTQLTALHPSGAMWLHDAPVMHGCPLKLVPQDD